MTIEPLTLVPHQDRAALLDLWVRAWTPVMPEIDFHARGPWFSVHLDRLVEGGALLLIARDVAPAAVAFLTVDPATGLIEQLAVDPDRAGQGLGRALMDEAKRLSPSGLNLVVNQGNARAVAFYGQAGFVVTAEAFGARSRLPVWAMAWTPAGPQDRAGVRDNRVTAM